MRFRSFGRTGWAVSALGSGCMRLPTLGKYEEIDEPAAVKVIRRAIDGGVNYVDTAYGYHGGNSERVLGMALRDGYRGRVKVATKLPPWQVKTAADFDRILDEQTARLGGGMIDLYLVHSLNGESWRRMRDLGVLPWLARKKAEGRIGWPGFSFHGELPDFKEILDAWDGWVFTQIQYNYMDEKTQAGTEGLQYAARKGLAVVAMEPLLGGNLADPPPAVRDMWATAATRRSPVDWALQWLWNKSEVSVVLSGMSALAQVEENLACADRSGPGTLTRAETDLVADVAAAYARLRPIPCTRCNYCMPCPHGVAIPHNLGLYNTSVSYNRLASMKQSYKDAKPESRASACTACRECEGKCPQKIVVSEWMIRIDKELGTAAG